MYKEYDLNARVVERKFRRELNRQGYFRTAKGSTNYLVAYEKDCIYLKSVKGVKPFRLKREMVRKAISYMYFKRTTVRKDMEAFTEYSSALFGILTHIFRHISKLQTLKFGEFRISLIGTLFFASGLERSPELIKKVLKKLGGKRVLFNYKSILESSEALNMLEKYDLYALIDSGAFSFYNEKNKKGKKAVQQQMLFEESVMDDLTLEGYAKFINDNKNNKRILGFLPLDVVGDPLKTKNNYRKLKEMTPGAIIFPVWQFTDSIEELECLVNQEHEVIALGGIVPYLSSRKPFIRTVLDKVFAKFPEQNFHALGLADELLMEYNFFSSDSTAFLNARKYKEGRKVYLENGERIPAPADMSTKEIIIQNLKFLLSLETLTGTGQLTLDSLMERGA